MVETPPGIAHRNLIRNLDMGEAWRGMGKQAQRKVVAGGLSVGLVLFGGGVAAGKFLSGSDGVRTDQTCAAAPELVEPKVANQPHSSVTPTTVSEILDNPFLYGDTPKLVRIVPPKATVISSEVINERIGAGGPTEHLPDVPLDQDKRVVTLDLDGGGVAEVRSAALAYAPDGTEVCTPNYTPTEEGTVLNNPVFDGYVTAHTNAQGHREMRLTTRDANVYRSPS